MERKGGRGEIGEPRLDELVRGLNYCLINNHLSNAIRWTVYMQEKGLGKRAWIYLIRYANEYISVNYGTISTHVFIQFQSWNQKMKEWDRAGAVKCIKSAITLLCTQPQSELYKSANTTFALRNRGHIEETDWKVKLSMGDTLQKMLRNWIRGHKPMVKQCLSSFVHSVWNRDELSSLRLVTIAYHLGYGHYIWILLYLLGQKFVGSLWVCPLVLSKHKEWLISSSLLDINEIPLEEKEEGEAEKRIIPWYIKSKLKDGKERIGIDTNLDGSKLTSIPWKINTDHFRLCCTEDIIHSMSILVRCIIDIVRDLKPLELDELIPISSTMHDSPEELLKTALDTSKFYSVHGKYVDCFTERGRATYNRTFSFTLKSFSIKEKGSDDCHDYKKASIDLRLLAEVDKRERDSISDWHIYSRLVESGNLSNGENESHMGSALSNFKKLKHSNIDPKSFTYHEEEEQQPSVEEVPIVLGYFSRLLAVLKLKIQKLEPMVSVLLDFITVRLATNSPISETTKVLQSSIDGISYLTIVGDSKGPLLLSNYKEHLPNNGEEVVVFKREEDEALFKQTIYTYIHELKLPTVDYIFDYLGDKLLNSIPEMSSDRKTFSSIYTHYIHRITPIKRKRKKIKHI
jgi:hypothetical protein